MGSFLFFPILGSNQQNAATRAQGGNGDDSVIQSCMIEYEPLEPNSMVVRPCFELSRLPAHGYQRGFNGLSWNSVARIHWDLTFKASFI